MLKKHLWKAAAVLQKAYEEIYTFFLLHMSSDWNEYQENNLGIGFQLVGKLFYIFF